MVGVLYLASYLYSFRMAWKIRLKRGHSMARILLVDDEKNVLRSLSIGLKRHAYTVVQARSGSEALEKMEEDPCDVVISDVRMSPMDGYTLASHIRLKYPWVCVILMSAFGFDEEHVIDSEGHAYPRFTKPFPVSELVRVIEEELSGNAGRKILLIGEPAQVERIQEVLESVGFLVHVYTPRRLRMDWIHRIPYDYFFIDGEILNDTKWKILNEIDRCVPKKPVYLLAQNEGSRNRIEHPELGITFVDKQMFYSDQSWISDLLNQSSAQQPGPARVK